MLTASHPSTNGVWTNQHSLSSAIPTVAHALGAAGFNPVLAGRMHAVGPDQLHGYTDRLVGDHGPNFLGGTAPGRGSLEGTAGPSRISLECSGSGQGGYEIHDEAVTEAAVDYLKPRNSDTPFALSVGFMLPHPPYVARQRDFSRYLGRVPMPSSPKAFTDESHPFLKWWRESGGIVLPVAEHEVRNARTAYYAMVDRMDAMIGRLLSALNHAGLRDETVVVYTSDHGDMLGEHGLWWKHVFYEESARVPMIISWPKNLLPFPAGRRIANPVGAIDLSATILEIMGAPPLPASDGRSFLPLLTGNQAGWENVAFSEYCSDEAFAPPEGTFQRMIRSENWKYIYYHDGPDQLFDLRTDPEERENLAGESGLKETARQLRNRVMHGWDPEHIKNRMALMRERDKLLTDWGKATNPPDAYRWPMTDGMNYLD